MRRKTPKVERRLGLREVADLLKLKGKEHYRCQAVRRMFQRFERRDGTQYLFRDGRRWTVPVSAIEHAMRWDAGTIAAIAARVDEVGHAVETLKKRVNWHGGRISKLEQLQELTRDYLEKSAAITKGH